jgi:hypothetical protein
VDPLARRILDEIQHAQLSAADRAELASALGSAHHRGHPSPTATWSSTTEFLLDLSEWAAGLPPEDLPPRQADAARGFGRTPRTIRRWLSKAGIADWDGFLRYWSLAVRGGVTVH